MKKVENNYRDKYIQKTKEKQNRKKGNKGRESDGDTEMNMAKIHSERYTGRQEGQKQSRRKRPR